MNSPHPESLEDSYITSTSLAPASVYMNIDTDSGQSSNLSGLDDFARLQKSGALGPNSSHTKQLVGSSVEGIIQDLIKQVEVGSVVELIIPLESILANWSCLFEQTQLECSTLLLCFAWLE